MDGRNEDGVKWDGGMCKFCVRIVQIYGDEQRGKFVGERLLDRCADVNIVERCLDVEKGCYYVFFFKRYWVLSGKSS